MKIAIPSDTDKGLDSNRSGHFGYTPFFTILTVENGNIKAVEALRNVDHDIAGCDGVINFVMTLGVDAILTVGMGMQALMKFTNAGITVYTETQTANVGEVARMFANGKVRKMLPDDACSQAKHHSHVS